MPGARFFRSENCVKIGGAAERAVNLVSQDACSAEEVFCLAKRLVVVGIVRTWSIYVGKSVNLMSQSPGASGRRIWQGHLA